MIIERSTVITAYIHATAKGAGLWSTATRDGGGPVTVDARAYSRLSYTARRIDEAGGAPTFTVEIKGGVTPSVPQALASAHTFTSAPAHARNIDITDEAIIVADTTTASSVAGVILEITLYLTDA